ncbi:MAG TPA: ABC transporter substrate-binding protein [Chloroflexota bacterium]|nr:ABC transporter substrate-binding protein [Chloroflexota bacterium]
MKLFVSLALATILAACGGSAAPSAPVAPASTAPSSAGSAKPAASAAASGAGASAKPAASAGASAAATAAANLEPLKTAYGGAVLLQIPLWSAIDGGFFKKYGFNPADPILASGRTALDQLIAGQVDLIGAGPYAAALGVGSGANIRMFAAFSNKEPFNIYSLTSITSPEQLIGKTVATSGPASESATAFNLYLKKVGIDASKITFVTEATTSDQQTAILSGQVQAIASTPPLLQPDIAAKLHVLYDLIGSGIAWNPNGFHVSQALMNSQPDKVARMLEGLEEGGAYAYNNPDFTKGLVKKYMKMDDSYLQEAFDVYHGLQAKNLAPSQDALDTVMGQVIENNKGMTKEKIQDFYTSKILDQLKTSGFLDKNGAPGA